MPIRQFQPEQEPNTNIGPFRNFTNILAPGAINPITMNTTTPVDTPNVGNFPNYITLANNQHRTNFLGYSSSIYHAYLQAAHGHNILQRIKNNSTLNPIEKMQMQSLFCETVKHRALSDPIDFIRMFFRAAYHGSVSNYLSEYISNFSGFARFLYKNNWEWLRLLRNVWPVSPNYSEDSPNQIRRRMLYAVLLGRINNPHLHDAFTPSFDEFEDGYFEPNWYSAAGSSAWLYGRGRDADILTGGPVSLTINRAEIKVTRTFFNQTNIHNLVCDFLRIYAFNQYAWEMAYAKNNNTLPRNIDNRYWDIELACINAFAIMADALEAARHNMPLPTTGLNGFLEAQANAPINYAIFDINSLLQLANTLVAVLRTLPGCVRDAPDNLVSSALGMRMRRTSQLFLDWENGTDERNRNALETAGC
jgi:hypothetical protein